MVRKIILDCDPGHDDAVALFMALASADIDLLLVTTVGGNQTLNKTFSNARSLLALAHMEHIPVLKGRAQPLIRSLEIAADVHGDTGLDGSDLPKSSAPIDERSALEGMRDAILESPEPVTLVATGPLTNVALLLLAYPEVTPNIETISFMGGACFGGNKTPVAEFNMYVDPEAAAIVAHAGVPLVMAGLDVTHKAQLMEDELHDIESYGTKVSATLGALLRFYHRTTTRPLLAPKGHVEGLHLHDPCAMAYVIKPELFTGMHLNLQVLTGNGATRGMTLIDHNKSTDLEPNCYVLFDVNRRLLIDLVTSSLTHQF